LIAGLGKKKKKKSGKRNETVLLFEKLTEDIYIVDFISFHFFYNSIYEIIVKFQVLVIQNLELLTRNL